MNLTSIILSLILFSVAEGIKPVMRVAEFPTMKGQSRVDMATYDPSLIKRVDPIPISTLVEVLKLSSEETLKQFKSTHNKAVQGAKTLIGKSYVEQAQEHYFRLLLDWLPMNEAESAAAKYLLSLPTCAIRSTKEMDPSMTACQHHGTKILSEIIRRLAVLDNLLTLGTVGDEPSSPKPAVPLAHPTALYKQMKNIVKLFAGEETTRLIAIISPSLAKNWLMICRNVQNKAY